jgi:hypothetical protein
VKVRIMTFPTEWKNNPNVPNHQSDCHFPKQDQLFPTFQVVLDLVSG